MHSLRNISPQVLGTIVASVLLLAWILWRRELGRIRENSTAGFLQPGSSGLAWLRTRRKMDNLNELLWAIKNSALAIIAAPVGILLLVISLLPGDADPKNRVFSGGLALFFLGCSWYLGRAARESYRKAVRKE